MERHRCRLCFRNFGSGRALGGHMRSHMMMNLLCASKQEEEQEEKATSDVNIQEANDVNPVHMSFSLTPPSPSSEEEQEKEVEEAKGLLSYDLRESLKKNARLVDPKFDGSPSHDWESETESSKDNPNPLWRGSKRVRKSTVFYSNRSPLVEAEPLSSISDTTPEEDVAHCLMMLSRDKWEREETGYVQVEDEDSQDSGAVKVKRAKVGGKYRCETCSKLFRSYQALGGHRASHKKVRLVKVAAPPEVAAPAVEERTHECPFCDRVFSSGQALGGHKRSHFVGAAAAVSANGGNNVLSRIQLFSRIGETLDIDLNLPAAPVDGDDDKEISQVAISAVSDAEVFHHR